MTSKMQWKHVTYARNTIQLNKRNPSCSKFPIVKKLSKQTLGHVIGLFKTIFAEYGIPAVVYTDQGAQFASKEFRAFTVQYRFQMQAQRALRWMVPLKP